MAPCDPHSFADKAQALTQSVVLDLVVDFATKTLFGTALLFLDREAPGSLDLDTRGLAIEKATDASGAEVPLVLDEPHPIKGSRLRLSLKSNQVTITFKTSPTSTALQWLDPAQTKGGKEPYLFSQCQAIHARSVFPCQDTPEIRIKYKARLQIPSNLSAVMSAKHLGRELPPSTDGAPSKTAVEVFTMEQTIPPYLFALAVGDLTHKELSPRVKVYAEPSVVEAAAEEFSGVESWISAAETLFGPYGWEEFNMLIMPPSFPYGGMENPRMTFLTPTLLVGDKSLVNVVAHELAHSWTGNLVTNANAAHFWLNEGWTVYAERRILDAVEGREGEQLHAAIGFSSLKTAVHNFEEQEKKTPGLGLRFTQLAIGESGLADVDPDISFSQVPYEKGFLFLTRLEQEVGRAAFDSFVSKYIHHFAFKSITTEEFLDFLKKELPAAASAVDLQTWIYGQGIPDDAPLPHSAALDAIKAAAAAIEAASGKGEATEAAALPRDGTVSQWGSGEWAAFVVALPRTLSPSMVTLLESKYHFSQNHNLEIAEPFLAIALRSSGASDSMLDHVRTILMTTGRMKYLKPLYMALLEGQQRALAAKIYEEARPKYHPIAQTVIDSVLKH